MPTPPGDGKPGDGDITVSKRDLVTGKELPGAKLTITNENRETVDTWTSTYVSSSYLVMEKPVKQTASAGSSDGANTGSTESNANGVSSDKAVEMRDLKAEYDAARAAGDTARAQELFVQFTGVSGTGTSGGSGASGATGGGSSEVASADISASLSQDFVNYLNSQRAAEGLSELSWDDGMASTALERAEEIVNDFSHNGSRGCSLEIIQKIPSSDVSSWYTNFYNSSYYNRERKR